MVWFLYIQQINIRVGNQVIDLSKDQHNIQYGFVVQYHQCCGYVYQFKPPTWGQRDETIFVLQFSL